LIVKKINSKTICHCPFQQTPSYSFKAVLSIELLFSLPAEGMSVIVCVGPATAYRWVEVITKTKALREDGSVAKKI
jgi:hypothetical protein